MTPAAGLRLVDQLLRDRDAVVARIDAGVDLAALARTMIATIAIAMALVGAAIGTYRGGVQVAYAAVKLPLLLLLAAALCAPTLTAFGIALGRPASLRADLARLLTAVALGALVLLAQAPILLLARAAELDYHRTTLLMVGCFGVAGISAVSMLARAIRGRMIVAAVAIVFAMVGGQLSWTLRPYLVRPRTEEVPFVRSLEGSLYDAVMSSTRSARGVYLRERAP
jgi:hypothetical protein